MSSDLDRVRQVARKDRDVRFTALLHHVTVDRLREAYRAISPNAAAGVDGVTWRDYGRVLSDTLGGDGGGVSDTLGGDGRRGRAADDRMVVILLIEGSLAETLTR